MNLDELISHLFIHTQWLNSFARLQARHHAHLFIHTPRRHSHQIQRRGTSGRLLIHPDTLQSPHSRANPCIRHLFIHTPTAQWLNLPLPCRGRFIYSYAGRRLLTPRGTTSSGRSIYSSAHRYRPIPIARLKGTYPPIHSNAQRLQPSGFRRNYHGLSQESPCLVSISLELP